MNSEKIDLKGLPMEMKKDRKRLKSLLICLENTDLDTFDRGIKLRIHNYFKPTHLNLYYNKITKFLLYYIKLEYKCYFFIRIKNDIPGIRLYEVNDSDLAEILDYFKLESIEELSNESNFINNDFNIIKNDNLINECDYENINYLNELPLRE
jgi:hypothetical protein